MPRTREGREGVRIQSFFTLVSAVAPEAVTRLDDSALEQGAVLPELKPWWRGLVALMLMAAAEEAKRGDSPARARELLEVAFLELTEFRNVMHRHGVPFPVFPPETTDQRRERLRHGALASDHSSALFGDARLSVPREA